jgi:hypothetical protein
MSPHVRRRQFITLLGGAAVAWPLAARAQSAVVTVIGFLGGANPVGYAVPIEALRSGLREHGYVEGQNIKIEYRWVHGQYERPRVQHRPLQPGQSHCSSLPHAEAAAKAPAGPWGSQVAAVAPERATQGDLIPKSGVGGGPGSVTRHALSGGRRVVGRGGSRPSSCCRPSHAPATLAPKGLGAASRLMVACETP